MQTRNRLLDLFAFSEGANSPDILRASDFPQAKESGCLVMRKVDMDVDDFFVSR